MQERLDFLGVYLLLPCIYGVYFGIGIIPAYYTFILLGELIKRWYYGKEKLFWEE